MRGKCNGTGEGREVEEVEVADMVSSNGESLGRKIKTEKHEGWWDAIGKIL